MAISARPPVQHNPCLLKPAHKFAVGNTALPGSSATRIIQRLRKSVFCCADPCRKSEGPDPLIPSLNGAIAFSEPVALRQAQNLLAPLNSFTSSFCSWHFSLRQMINFHPDPFLSGRQKKPKYPTSFYLCTIGLAYKCRIYQFPHPLARFLVNM